MNAVATTTRLLIAAQLGIPDAELDVTKSFRDLGGDSLDDIELIMTIEDEFERGFFGAEVDLVIDRPISEFIAFVEKKVAEGAAA